MGTTAAQWGHLPFFPAELPGTRTAPRQAGQENSIDEEADGFFASPFHRGFAAGVGPAFGADGTAMTVPQCGHLPFLPALAAGRLSVF
jgi:hypothetical protein